MRCYAKAAPYYDLLYAGVKDYEAESARLEAILAGAPGPVRHVLDVACGTGRHAEQLARAGFRVDGLDLEPEFVRIASERHAQGQFRIGDMTSFEVEKPYDALVCLFGAIGYVRDEDRLRATAACFARAVRPGGLVVVEPWLEPAEIQDGRVAVLSAQAENQVVSRVSRTVVRGRVSRLEFAYLVGRPQGIEHWTEHHDLGLFPRELMIEALETAGLRVTVDPAGLSGRRLYLATRAS